MATAKREANILTDLERLASLNEAAGIPVGDDGLPAPDYNRHSCGSFFMNPILTADQAAALPEDAPKFDATLPDGTPGTKTSAAWLIDHAGCHKGYKVDADAPASLSTQHTLALTDADAPAICRSGARTRWPRAVRGGASGRRRYRSLDGARGSAGR